MSTERRFPTYNHGTGLDYRNLVAFTIVFLVATTISSFGCITKPTSSSGKLIVGAGTVLVDSGLADYLVSGFSANKQYETKIVSGSTGQLLGYGATGDVDIIIGNSMAAMQAFVNGSKGLWMKPVCYNQFIIVGPIADPAYIKGMTDPVAAFRAIAAAGAAFCSRGDASGTNVKELSFWKSAGLAPDPRTDGWYLNLSQGAGETLVTSNEKNAYTLTDEGTWWSQTGKTANLSILVQGNISALKNQYWVIPVNASAGPHVHAFAGLAFGGWLIGPAGQALIAKYQQHGHQLFYPDAI
jgi:tungstate transport system substrate-binding protein